MSHQPVSRKLIIGVACLLYLTACGGGGGSAISTANNSAGTQGTSPNNTTSQTAASTNAGTNTNTNTNTTDPTVIPPIVSTNTLTLDLKNSASASTIAAMIIDQLTPPNFNSTRTSNYVVQVNGNRPRTPDCYLVNSNCEVLTSAGERVTVGDKFESYWTQARSGDAELLEIKDGTRKEEITSITGDGSVASGTSNVQQTVTEKTTTIFDRALNAINGLEKLYRVIALDFSQLRSYSHDGKNTASEADDVDTVKIDVKDISNGTANSAAIALSKIYSLECSQAKNALTTCSKTDGTFTGNYIKLGTFNIFSKVQTPMQFDAVTNDPISGSLVLTQAGETVTLVFSRGTDTFSQVKVTDASGAIQTLSFSAFKSLAANLY
jgi:hypothetical protein